MWLLKDTDLNSVNRASKEATFTLGNGYFGVRGFFEEEQEGLLSLGGIYMAGIFGDGNLQAWKGKNRELVNVPNFLSVKILCDGELVEQKDYTEYTRTLDIQHGILTRSYVWKNKLKLEFERFASVKDFHTVCQKIKFTKLQDCKVEVDDAINVNTTNLNKVSCEPLPIQPGDKHYTVLENTGKSVTVLTDGIDPKKIYINQTTEFDGNEFIRTVKVYTDRDEDINKEPSFDYDTYKQRHIDEWERRWAIADIQIENDENDQLALRYNLFQLMQVCPNKDTRISIGARGLTGEMYEGCIFWDTEIFELPFFIYENPEAARDLLQFRYNMLPEAKAHARDLWFDGAMYPWQSCNLGYEATEKNVGAYYSIHVIADIAYGIMRYYDATADIDFIINYGAEILVETARFWRSRVTPRDNGTFELLALRGPNEYDVLVNNNLYTNMMMQENMQSAVDVLDLLKKDYPEAYAALCDKVHLKDDEVEAWLNVAKNIVICYNPETKLYEEDDKYTQRMPLDLKKAKPTDKRIIDSTIPYEALPFYQVTKQGDVIHLMINLPNRFTKEEMLTAWNYYEPRTAHDTSLSYCTHAIIATKLGMDDIAYKYFKTCLYLDIEDLKLNNISGLHFANFGGTWQGMVYGFAGFRVKGNTVTLEPNMPKKWGDVKFNLLFKGNRIAVCANGRSATAQIVEKSETPITIEIL